MRIRDIVAGLVLMGSIAGAQDVVGRQLAWEINRVPLRPATRVATPADSVPFSIAAAEAAGRTHPRRSVGGAFPRWIDSIGYVGTTERRCVEVGDAPFVRSGEFVVGRFPGLRPYAASPIVKLWWQPWHGARPDAPTALVVRSVRLDAVERAHIHEGEPTTSLVPLRESPALATGTYVGTSGRWMLVATAAENWGCFVVTSG